MKNLLITLLATSSVDSLNPIGITQQFILQGMVKKPRHIWYFILTTAVVNIIFGYLVYYGVIALIDNLLRPIMEQYVVHMYSLEVILGLIMLVVGAILLTKRLVAQKKDVASFKEKHGLNEDSVRSKFRHVTPLALINIGIISTASELTSALPYFAFLSVLITYSFSFPVLTFVLICYNTIYSAPFVLLYFVYIISKKRFDSIYLFFRTKLSKYSPYCIPALLLIIAVVVIFNGAGNLVSVL